MKHDQTETALRLARAENALLQARENEKRALREWSLAQGEREAAKSRYEKLFLLNEQEVRERKTAGYRHSTK